MLKKELIEQNEKLRKTLSHAKSVLRDIALTSGETISTQKAHIGLVNLGSIPFVEATIYPPGKLYFINPDDFDLATLPITDYL